MGEYYFEQNNFKLAKENYKKCFDSTKKYILKEVSLSLGMIYFEEQNFNVA